MTVHNITDIQSPATKVLETVLETIYEIYLFLLFVATASACPQGMDYILTLDGVPIHIHNIIPCLGEAGGGCGAEGEAESGCGSGSGAPWYTLQYEYKSHELRGLQHQVTVSNTGEAYAKPQDQYRFRITVTSTSPGSVLPR
jgi:hypothetical protein